MCNEDCSERPQPAGMSGLNAGAQTGEQFSASSEQQYPREASPAKENSVVGNGDAPELNGRLCDVAVCLDAAIEQTPLLAVQCLARDGVIRIWNDACEKLFGIAREDAVGKRHDGLLTVDVPDSDFATMLVDIWDKGQPSMPSDWRITTASGKVVWVVATMFPVIRNGTTLHVLCTHVDITLRKEQEQRLRASEFWFHEFFEKSSDAIIVLRNGQFVEFNPAALILFGYDKVQSGMNNIEPHHVSPLHQPDGQLSREKMAHMHALAQANGNHRFEWQYCSHDRRAFWGEVALTAITVANETLLYAIVRDITERKTAEQALGLAAQVFESSHEAIVILDRDKRIISVNHAFTAITGYPANQVLGTDGKMMRSALSDAGDYDEIWLQIEQDGHWQGETLRQRRNGESFPAWASCTAVKNAARQVANYIVIFSDITQRKESERHIRHMIEHDFLTGLPNRVLLLDRLQQAIAAARRNRTKLAVLFIDLDRFKHINDSLGHHVGDKLLQAVAERLKKCVRGNDTVSRQGGDEFVVMLADIGGVEQAAHIADNILQVINMPYQIDEYALSITTCLGISMYPEDGQDIDALTRNADTAMYHAKASGRNSYQFFSHAMNLRIVERLALENHLKSALEQGQFSLQYQPEIDIASGRTVGVEALLRWQHPDAGLLTPVHFLAAAEQCGLMVSIGDWVLLAACRQARLWHDQGMPVVIGVNLSAIQFRQKDFLDKVETVLRQTGLAPQFLELEITESILIDSSAAVIETMHALRAMGVALAVDDFGTGYSSLSYLKHFPVDKLKIDQSFVRDLGDDANDAAIVRAILIMAKSLNLKVIAEGVETIDQLTFLQSQGCDHYQGYYVTPPMLAADLPGFYQLN